MEYKLTVVERRQCRTGPVSEVRYRLELPEVAIHPLLLLSTLRETFTNALAEMVSSAPQDSVVQLYAVQHEMRVRCVASNRARPDQVDIDKFLERVEAFIHSEGIPYHDIQYSMITLGPPPPF